MVNALKKKLFLALLALFSAFFASAATPTDISLDLQADTFYVSPGDNFNVNFTLYNPMPSGDDLIERMDVYLLDLKDSGFSVASVQDNGWKYTHVERFNDEQFWISNAKRQNLLITLKAEANAKTSEIKGFYSFSKTSGTPLLKDHSEFKIKLNVVPQGTSKQPPTKSIIPQKEQDLNNLITILTAVIAVLAVALTLVLLVHFRKKHAHERHLKKH